MPFSYKLLAVLCLLVGGTTAWPTKPTAQTLASDQERTKPVEVQALKTLLKPVIYSLPAKVVARNTSRLAAQTSGVVREWRVLEVETVRQGDVLLVLDCQDQKERVTQIEASIKRLNNQIKLAKTLSQRSAKLVAGGSVSREMHDTRKTEQSVLLAQLSETQSSLRSARLAAARCTITAPFAGHVVERLVHVGGWVAPGVPVAVLVDAVGLEIEAGLTEDESQLLGLVKTGEFHWAGNVTQVNLARMSEVFDSQTKTRNVRLSVHKDNPPPVGMVGSLLWQQPYFTLANDAMVVKRGDDYGIFWVDAQTKARFAPLNDYRPGSRIVVPTDWSHDWSVVVAGHQSLFALDNLSLESK